jgi:nitrogen fixation NifU-like protein
MYSEKVLDHFTNPRNVGEIPDADGVGEVGNARCGDIMKMYLKIDGDTITDVKFKTFGCGAAIATSSIATEMIKGRSINEALALSNRAVVEALDGLPPAKLHCSVLAEQAVKAALSDYYPPGHRSRTHRRSCQKGCPRGRRGGRCLPLLRHLRPLRIKKIPSPLSGGGIFSF